MSLNWVGDLLRVVVLLLLLHVKLDNCLLLMRKNTVFRYLIRTEVREYLLGKDFLQLTLLVFWPVLALKVGKKP